MGSVPIAAVCYAFSTVAIVNTIPSAALRVLASPFGDATCMALSDTTEAIISFCATAGRLGFLGGRTLLARQIAKAVAGNGLFPPVFAYVDRAGTPMAGLIIIGTLMTVSQLGSMLPNAVRESSLVSLVSAIFTPMPYPYTYAVLLLLSHGYFGKARPMYLLATLIAFAYCIWAIVGSGAKRVIWPFVTLMIITVLYALNHNWVHKNPYPLDAPVNNS